MNCSTDFLGMLERALQDRYEAGVEAGRLETNIAAEEAHAEGYAQAMHEVANWALVKTRLPDPETEPPHLSPAKAKIVDHIRAFPGVTAAEIQRACGGSNSAIYDLHKLGLVIKTGRQFYPNL